MSAFTGPVRWWRLACAPIFNGGFDTLAPRQQLTPTPYAIYAESGSASQLTGNIRTSNLSGSYNNALTFTNANNNFSGNGASVTNVNAASLGGLSSSNFWKSFGNAGTTTGTQFIGTTDNQPLEFRVNGVRGLRIEPGNPTNGAPNMIGGSENNVVDTGVVGAFIGGGGTTNYFGSAFKNRVSTDFGTIAGGYFNTIQSNAYQSSIVGGYGNTIQTGAQSSTIGGGQLNTIGVNAHQSTISGGNVNTIQAPRSIIGGGIINTIQSGDLSIIAGGEYNTIQSNAVNSVIGGGYYNTIQTLALMSTIAGGESNTIGANANHSSSAAAPQTINASASYAIIGGGYGNTASGPGAFVGGGGYDGTVFFGNTASNGASTVSGGLGNTANNTYATVGGGILNTASGLNSTVGGGYVNSANGDDATVGGGNDNSASNGATVSGGDNNSASDGATVSGGHNNHAINLYATVSGGGGNIASGGYAMVGEGLSTSPAAKTRRYRVA